MHVLHTFANNDHVPYLTWFTDRAVQEGDPTYTFLIMYPERPGIMDEMQAKGFKCEWIRYRDSHRKLDMLMALPRLWRYMRKYRPDIVHCNLFDDAVPGLIAAKLAGVKVRVITKQDTGYHYLHATHWMAVDRFNSRMATHVLAISNESKRFLIHKEGTPEHKITLVHNGIPSEQFTRQDPVVMDRLKQRFGTANKGPIIGTVARFIEWKGYKLILAAAMELVKEHPDALFLLCGSGAEEPEIRTMIEESGLKNNVVLTGWIDRSEMASFYGLLDVYFHAAILEPFGLVYPEAMMNSVPVVSTFTGAAADAIEDGKNGILVTERTGKALAEGVERLLRSDHRSIGIAGRKTALAMYSFDVMWQGTVDLYRNALKPVE